LGKRDLSWQRWWHSRFSLEASAHNGALEVLDALLRDIFNSAEKADKKARLRSLKTWIAPQQCLLRRARSCWTAQLAMTTYVARLFNELPRVALEKALEEVNALIRPANHVFYLVLENRYRSVRRFLPDLLKHIRFGFKPAVRGWRRVWTGRN